MAGVLSPKDLNKMAADSELAAFEEERQAKKRKADQDAELRESVFGARTSSRSHRSHQPGGQHSRQGGQEPVAGADLSQQLLQRWRPPDQQLRPGLAELARGLWQEGLRILRKRLAAARFQDRCGDHQLPGRNAGRRRYFPEVVTRRRIAQQTGGRWSSVAGSVASDRRSA